MSTKIPYRDAIAAYLAAHPNVWISAYTLMELGGKLAFRTRISDCRLELGMTIENKVERDPKTHVAESFYRYVPPVAVSLLELIDRTA